MMKPKPAKAARPAKSTHRFSLVSSDAQQEMYRALTRLGTGRAAKASPATGAEVAEIAVCLAAGPACPVILACAARGAGTVGSSGEAVMGTSGRRLTAATVAAVDRLLDASLAGTGISSRTTAANVKPGKPAVRPATEAVAIVCAGRMQSQPGAVRDYHAAFAFAARHKLPILYLVANRMVTDPMVTAAATREKNPVLDLRTLHPEFGIPLFTVDAADAIAAYRVATEALHNARHLRGPCVIEALTLPRPLAGANHNPLALLAAYMERHGNPPK